MYVYEARDLGPQNGSRLPLYYRAENFDIELFYAQNS